ncbi:DUF2971 domain-containing protein [Aeromonas piscicola]|uniref:DUF2971 domain-containing protein n=1 Tax=Aeromonas piscicola TaxID=600645 RepID=UPI0021F91056|nr:DUF2971 domain-containing protein [Aeromonas piscicola]MCW0504020.1 DUF2971 domain-containing protein [Aeromonas piscicola]
MDILYKYTSHIDSFFKKPTLKLSVPGFLNDPFEESISKDLYSRIECEEDGQAEWDCKAAIYELGVVSFSETSRNLLMWAHYANEHKGMCIGFDPSVLDSLEKYGYNCESYAYYPEKINYDNLRVDIHNLPDELFSESIAKKILTTKSDDWIYEKEHRCIVPIGWSDSAYLIKDNYKAEIALREFYSAYINPVTKEITSATNQNLMFEHITHYDGILFLKEINPEMVRTIHFGCKYPLDEIEKIINKISEATHPLHHLRMYRYSLDKYRFELESTLIYSEGVSYIHHLYSTK